MQMYCTGHILINKIMLTIKKVKQSYTFENSTALDQYDK